MPAALFSDVLKGQPDVGDVHIPSTGLGSRRRLFSDFIGQRSRAGSRVATSSPAPRIRTAKRHEGEPPRVLRPLDDQTAHSPFPYDPNFLASLRSDQKPRYYGALTDRSQLPDKTFDLAQLVATQNRVDPGKVQSMADSGVVAATPPLVGRHNGRDYILDGHHRLAADWLKGGDQAQAKFVDLSEISNAVKACRLADTTFELTKAQPRNQWVFGWASVVSKDGLLIVDKQDDVILPEELEKAVVDYVLYSRDHGEMHTTFGKGQLIESIVFTEEKQKALGIDLGMEGWWAGWHIPCPDLWSRHERGELPELSIGGWSTHMEI
jgi:hypothetical protein